MAFQTSTQIDEHPMVVYHLGEPPTLPPWLPTTGIVPLPELPATTEGVDFDGHTEAFRQARGALAGWDATTDTLNEARKADAGAAGAVQKRRAHIEAGLAMLARVRAACKGVAPTLTEAYEGCRMRLDNTPAGETTPAMRRRLAELDAAVSGVLSALAAIPQAERALAEAAAAMPPGPVGPPGPK